MMDLRALMLGFGRSGPLAFFHDSKFEEYIKGVSGLKPNSQSTSTQKVNSLSLLFTLKN